MLSTLSTFLALGLWAAVAAAQERQWTLDWSEEDAYLIFGVPESDDVGVSLWCPVGKDVVKFYVPLPTAKVPKSKDNATPITIRAGQVDVTLRGKADINRESAISSVEAEVPVNDPLVAALAGADRFTVKAGPTEVVFPLYDADLEGLLALCRKS